MIIYFINLFLQFFSRKIFLEYLGSEILGLNTTASNLLQFLNLAELGISSAVGFTLYKPLYEDDHKTINEIVTLQGHLYRRIAYFLIIGSAILMLFFPIIFKKIELPMWYAYTTYIALLISALMGYFVNYKQVVLSANQQEYKVLYSLKCTQFLKLILQIISVKYFSNGYIWWISLEVIFAVISSLTVRYVTNRTFEWLHDTNQSFKELRSKYTEFTKKIKQLFFHKIGSFALTQTSPLIIYGFTTLTTVTFYGNYLIIISGAQILITALFNGVTAGVGNLIAENNKEKAYSVFRELFSIRFLIVATACYVIYNIASDFITVWIGKEYVLEPITVALMVTTLFFSLIRATVDAFINGYALFQDIYAPIVEAFLNIGLSILFGYYFGLNGVLLGALTSLILVIYIWKPYFLFSRALKGYYRSYIVLILKHLLIGITIMLLCNYTLSTIINKGTSVEWLVYKSLIFGVTYGIILLLALSFMKCGTENFIKRIINFKF